MKHALVVVLMAIGAAACSCTERRDEGANTRTHVAGTVLDRATGEPIADALVTLPDGREARTDARGRFLVADLAVGLSGDLVARAEGGREGRVALRPLGRRQLEVVVYAGR